MTSENRAEGQTTECPRCHRILVGDDPAIDEETGLCPECADPYSDEKRAWLAEMFKYELCEECGKDADEHTVGFDILGNLHAYCNHPAKEDA